MELFVQFLPAIFVVGVLYLVFRFVSKKQKEKYGGVELIGIGGWLLFFIMGNTLAALGFPAAIVEELNAVGELPSFFKYGFYVGIFIYVSMTVFWVCCLYLLVTIDRRAIRAIKIAIVMMPITVALTPLLVLATWALTVEGVFINKAALSIMYPPRNIGRIFGFSLASVIWYSYFCVSVRVKNTWAYHERLRAGKVEVNEQEAESAV